jgi:hypothetical protein
MNFSKYKSAILTFALAVWIIFPFVILAFINFPSSDDYYDWMLLQKFGALKATWHYYFNWSGRYFTHLIAFLLNPLKLGERLGGSFSALLGITFLVIDAFLVSGILKATFQFRLGIQPVFTAFLILFFCYLPFPNETVYWYTGMIAYMPGFTACLYWMFLQLKADKIKIERILWFILPAFAGGSGELSLCLMGWLLVLNFNFTSVNRAYWILCGLFGIAAGIELLSPGSAERIRYFTETAGNPTENIAFAFSNSAMWLWHFLRDWTRSTPVLMMALVCGVFLNSDSIKRVPGKTCFLWSLGLLVPFAMLFIFHFGTGMSQPPNRLINVVYLFLQVFLFISIVYAVKQFGNVKVENGIRLLWFALILFVFQAGYSSRWRGAVSDFTVLQAYASSMHDRFVQTNQFKAQNTAEALILKPIESIPFTSFFSELSADSTHWYNEGYAAFHGIKAVRCKSYESER